MSPLPPEIQFLLESYKSQIAQLQLQQDSLRAVQSKLADDMRPAVRQEIELYRQQFDIRVREMEKDIEELKQIIKDLKEKDLAALQKALTQNQNDQSSRIIKLQTAILLSILGGIITLFVSYFKFH